MTDYTFIVPFEDTTVDFDLPNVIHPYANQEINRMFIVNPPNTYVMILEVSIYDRYGNIMYTCNSSDCKIGWDGTHNGILVEKGVYAYSIEYVYNGKALKVFGDVTVL